MSNDMENTGVFNEEWLTGKHERFVIVYHRLPSVNDVWSDTLLKRCLLFHIGSMRAFNGIKIIMYQKLESTQK